MKPRISSVPRDTKNVAYRMMRITCVSFSRSQLTMGNSGRVMTIGGISRTATKNVALRDRARLRCRE